MEKRKQLRKFKSVGTAEAFYLIFRSLPKKDRLSVIRYILEDEEIEQSVNLLEIPNEKTLKAFDQDKSTMPIFKTVEELKKDLLS
ncbi:MAG: hypothetical protein HQK76_21090 [Desulfobacterales bacterium]|nr:hypothetical protein [Desulfobacterales bacterium]